MAKLKGTRTATNLMHSFAGETQAATRYRLYSKVAKEEGYVQIANIFEETARNEIEHAKVFYNFLNEDMQDEKIEVTADFPVAYKADDTKTNLLSAAEGEREENEELYPNFADIAEEEGFELIAYRWREIAEVEEAHERRYRKLAQNIEEGRVFERDGEIYWKCINCGYIHKGTTPPDKCHACAHETKWFEEWCENY